MKKIACPHPIALQEKLARLGWFDWEPTPGITDEGAVLYISLGERHVFIMTTDEALALSDEHLQKRIESALGMTHEEACAQSVAGKDTCTHPKLRTLPVTVDCLYRVACTACRKTVSIKYNHVLNGEVGATILSDKLSMDATLFWGFQTEFCLTALITAEFGETWGQQVKKQCRCTRCTSEVPHD
jgi:hypothetical protein